MMETDYVRSVVIPVLEGEGYELVDFHHGPNEVGKDLIFYRTEPFEEKKMFVAVVKSERLTKSSSDKNGFPLVLVQIFQAIGNKITDFDGTVRRPDGTLLILADDPSHDILTSNLDLYEKCIQGGLRVIQGSKVAKSLLKHRPEVAEQILQSKLDTVGFLRANPTNIPLLNALNSELIDIETIFTDLDASIGAITISQALLLRSGSKDKFDIDVTHWQSVKKAIVDLESCLGPFLLDPIDILEARHLDAAPGAATVWKEIKKRTQNSINWATPGDREKIAWLAKLAEELPESTRKRGSAAQGLAEYSSPFFATPRLTKAGLATARKIDPDSDKNVNDLIDKLLLLARKIMAGNNPISDLDELAKILNLLYPKLDTVRRSLAERREKLLHDGADPEIIRVLVDRERQCRDLYDKTNGFGDFSIRYRSLVNYKLVFEKKSLDLQLSLKIKSLVNRYKSPQVEKSRQYASELLVDTKRYLLAIEAVNGNPALSGMLSPTAPSAKVAGPLGAPILGLLDSGIDLVVMGGAGSGKSTTLEMYARRRFSRRTTGEEVLFLPLAKLVPPTTVAGAAVNPLDHFVTEIARLFKITQPGITAGYLKKKINEAEQLTIILDGLDEASSLVPWLMSSIDELRKTKATLQVVASSRFSVPELSVRGFISIELLPFRPAQVKRFVADFLASDPVLAREVLDHLANNRGMLAVAKTPLMSTILCVLAKNGVALPSTKNALFKERFELLWAAYDARKNVKRTTSRRECLEDVSKKAAYYLHSHSLRSARREHIFKYVEEMLKQKYRSKALPIAFAELERPCNVLVEDAEGMVGFGHLSYQEYLVSEELYTSRHSEIVKRLDDPWWRGVLVLAAMKTEDIGSIIEERILHVGKVAGARATLKAMINVCPASQRETLTALLRDQASLDQWSDTGEFKEEYEDDPFNGQLDRYGESEH
ncbi:hypothetical protein HDG34_007828 [Paraburkholderia sp. HC6.4b]|uniref:NACHT domain-containing protein n=1 Tax=unclassified Paraburkholderia TaxID=2615204 RepID=UPI001612DCB2|nr:MULTISPECIES: hypothetical protein [unclassified Paraburkholderia]MBB5413845.1 hypothetical protein [Paraburkholderia sp. HC6.4b]MBB5456273.1 hypothetical protein [Paraburkholderia sp. Kb1A]